MRVDTATVGAPLFWDFRGVIDLCVDQSKWKEDDRYEGPPTKEARWHAVDVFNYLLTTHNMVPSRVYDALDGGVDVEYNVLSTQRAFTTHTMNDGTLCAGYVLKRSGAVYYEGKWDWRWAFRGTDEGLLEKDVLDWLAQAYYTDVYALAGYQNGMSLAVGDWKGKV